MDFDIANDTYQYEKFSHYPEISTDLRNKLHLTESQSTNLRIFDTQNNLALIHYITKDYNNPPEDVRDWRGVVVDTNTGKVVAKSFPFTPEYTLKDLSGKLSFPLTLDVAVEGTIIRVFRGNFSTHHFIDGRTSRWSPMINEDKTTSKGFRFVNPRSFYDIFVSIVGEDFISRLRYDYCYVFLLVSNENRIINPVPKDKVVLLTTYDENMNRVVSLLDENVNVHNPIKRTFNNFEELETAIGESECGFVYNGTSSEMFKIMNERYLHLRKIRGNEPNVLIRYLSLFDRKEELRQIYPEYSMAFSYIDTQLVELYYTLTNAYKIRYMEGRYYYLPPMLHNFLSRMSKTEYYEESIKTKLDTLSGKELYSCIGAIPSSEDALKGTAPKKIYKKKSPSNSPKDEAKDVAETIFV